MEELSPLTLLYKRHRLACCPVQTKPQASSLRSMLRRQASWLRLDGCLLTLHTRHRHHSQTLQPDHSVFRRQAQWCVFSHRKMWGFDSRNALGHSKKENSSRRFWTIVSLNSNRNVLERLRLFPPIFLIILATVETEIFFFSAMSKILQ